jgi:hypothetical protein
MLYTIVRTLWNPSVCVFSVFVLAYAGIVLEGAEHPTREVYQLSIRYIISEIFLNVNRSNRLIRQGKTRSNSPYHLKAINHPFRMCVLCVI